MNFTFTSKHSTSTRILSSCIAISMGLMSVTPPQAMAQAPLSMPAPTQILQVTSAYQPTVIKGLILDPKTPFTFDFLIDTGDSTLDNIELKSESNRLIKYFLAALTIPEHDLWVNLSPDQSERIIPEEFGMTEMGRDLLSQDYLLKQLTASLMHPDDDIGQKFWSRVYRRAQQQFGTTDIPIDTLSRVWVVPEIAKIHEHENTAFVTQTHLKVMLESEYKGQHIRQEQQATEIVREILIPELEREINQGQHFARLRQAYYSLILASWYKQTLRNSILNQVYTNRNKVTGIETDDPESNKNIYNNYLEAFKKGVYNFVKEDIDPSTGETIPRHYMSGGFTMRVDRAMTTDGLPKDVRLSSGFKVKANLKPSDLRTPEATPNDNAMMSWRGLVQRGYALFQQILMPGKQQNAVSQSIDRFYRQSQLQNQAVTQKGTLELLGHAHLPVTAISEYNDHLNLDTLSVEFLTEALRKNRAVIKSYREDVERIRRVVNNPANKIEYVAIEGPPSNAGRLNRMADRSYELMGKQFSALGIKSKRQQDRLYLLLHGPAAYLHATDQWTERGIELIGAEDEVEFYAALAAHQEVESSYRTFIQQAKIAGVDGNALYQKILVRQPGYPSRVNVKAVAGVIRSIEDSLVARYFEILVDELMNADEIQRNRDREMANNLNAHKGNGLMLIGSNHIHSIADQILKLNSDQPDISADDATPTTIPAAADTRDLVLHFSNIIIPEETDLRTFALETYEGMYDDGRTAEELTEADLQGAIYHIIHEQLDEQIEAWLRPTLEQIPSNPDIMFDIGELLINAIDAVHMRFGKNYQDGIISVNIYTTDDVLRIDVVDNGIGIDTLQPEKDDSTIQYLGGSKKGLPSIERHMDNGVYLTLEQRSDDMGTIASYRIPIELVKSDDADQDSAMKASAEVIQSPTWLELVSREPNEGINLVDDRLQSLTRQTTRIVDSRIKIPMNGSKRPANKVYSGAHQYSTLYGRAETQLKNLGIYLEFLDFQLVKINREFRQLSQTERTNPQLIAKLQERMQRIHRLITTTRTLFGQYLNMFHHSTQMPLKVISKTSGISEPLLRQAIERQSNLRLSHIRKIINALPELTSTSAWYKPSRITSSVTFEQLQQTKTEIDREIGSIFLGIRVQKQLTAQQVTEKIGNPKISKFSLLEFENGNKSYRQLDILAELAQVYRVDLKTVMAPLEELLAKENRLSSEFLDLQEHARQNMITLRKSQGLTQKDLASGAGIPKALITYIEYGSDIRGNPARISPYQISRLAHSLRVSAIQLWPVNDLLVYDFVDQAMDSGEQNKVSPNGFAMLTRNPADSDPHLKRKDPYGETLRQVVFDTNITAHSIERRNVLTRAGRHLEKIARQIFKNPNIKIAVYPAGSALVGYAGTDSDVEFGISIIDGLDQTDAIHEGDYIERYQIEEDLYIAQTDEFFAAAYDFLDIFLKTRGYSFKTDEDWAVYISTLANWTNLDSENFNVDTRGNPRDPLLIAENLAYLFMPTAYGDKRLIERARKNAIQYVSNQSNAKDVWNIVRFHFSSAFTSLIHTRYKQKPHLRSWLHNQGVDSNNPDLDAFAEEWGLRVVLPDLKSMQSIFGIKAPARLTVDRAMSSFSNEEGTISPQWTRLDEELQIDLNSIAVPDREQLIKIATDTYYFRQQRRVAADQVSEEDIEGALFFHLYKEVNKLVLQQLGDLVLQLEQKIDDHTFRMDRTIGEIIMNSIDAIHMRHGSEHRNGIIKLNIKWQEDGLQIAFIDNGIGIDHPQPIKSRSNIFYIGGFKFGLDKARSVAEHGIEFTIRERTDEQGTIATFRIPAENFRNRVRGPLGYIQKDRAMASADQSNNRLGTIATVNNRELDLDAFVTQVSQRFARQVSAFQDDQVRMYFDPTGPNYGVNEFIVRNDATNELWIHFHGFVKGQPYGPDNDTEGYLFKVKGVEDGQLVLSDFMFQTVEGFVPSDLIRERTDLDEQQIAVVLKKAAKYVQRYNKELVTTLSNPSTIQARSLFAYRHSNGQEILFEMPRVSTDSDDPIESTGSYRASVLAQVNPNVSRVDQIEYTLDFFPAGPQTDQAMTSPEKVGGIDFTSKYLDIEIQRDDQGIPLPLTPTQLQQIDIPGLIPVIIDIQPITNLPLLLGMVDENGNPITPQENLLASDPMATHEWNSAI